MQQRATLAYLTVMGRQVTPPLTQHNLTQPANPCRFLSLEPIQKEVVYPGLAWDRLSWSWICLQRPTWPFLALAVSLPPAMPDMAMGFLQEQPQTAHFAVHSMVSAIFAPPASCMEWDIVCRM
jgi:hypothetical protein